MTLGPWLGSKGGPGVPRIIRYEVQPPNRNRNLTAPMPMLACLPSMVCTCGRSADGAGACCLPLCCGFRWPGFGHATLPGESTTAAACGGAGVQPEKRGGAQLTSAPYVLLPVCSAKRDRMYSVKDMRAATAAMHASPATQPVQRKA